jgi:hypothetical protein
MLAAGAALLAGLAWAEPVPWIEWPRQGTLHYNNYYLDPGLKFEGQPMSRRVFDYENDKDSELVFIPPDPARPTERGFLLKARLRSGAGREETFGVRNHKGKTRWSSYHVVYRDPAGKVIREGEFDLTEPALKMPDDVYHGNSMIFIVMALPFKEGYEQELIGWTTPQIAYALTARVAGIEEVKVPAGVFKCWRVEISPLVSDYFGSLVGTLVRPFVPPFTVWYTVAAPHLLVRFEGGVAVSPSLDMPVVVRELTRIEGMEAPK